jgi:hypothetical protein
MWFYSLVGYLCYGNLGHFFFVGEVCVLTCVVLDCQLRFPIVLWRLTIFWRTGFDSSVASACTHPQCLSDGLTILKAQSLMLGLLPPSTRHASTAQLAKWQTHREPLIMYRANDFKQLARAKEYARTLSEHSLSTALIENTYGRMRDLETRRAKHTSAQDNQVLRFDFEM